LKIQSGASRRWSSRFSRNYAEGFRAKSAKRAKAAKQIIFSLTENAHDWVIGEKLSSVFFFAPFATFATFARN
jgi:hypothetical protein